MTDHPDRPSPVDPPSPHDRSTGLSRRRLLAAGAVVGSAAVPLTAPRAHAVVPEPLRVPEAVGTGGAVSSVDPYASDVGIAVLRAGGNAADAAIAMAAVLGVTEPFSCGIGGGGFFVFRDARSGRITTVNGRETAPQSYTAEQFTDGSGTALPFSEVVNSGQSIGVPGTLLTWEAAARRFGTRRLDELLAPAERIAREGFVADANYVGNVTSNATRFRRFPETARVFLPGGNPPAVGDTITNPDLARTYALLRRRGIGEFYRGSIGRALLAEVRRPSTAPGVTVRPGEMTEQDLRRYTAPFRPPTRSTYGRYELWGMSIPSSGGIAVGEIANLMQAYDRITGRPLAKVDEVTYLHRFSEACATAFADRNRWVGDVRGVPVAELLDPRFAAERAALFDPDRAQPRPLPFGFPDGDYETAPPVGGRQGEPYEGPSTTHLNAVDRWGNVVSYTLTIEQTGGSGITVPGHGFLLNNELTDFNFVPLTAGVPDPNLPGPGKRPRSSMSPTIVTDRDRPVLTAGTPGGATIITTVAQIVLGHLGRGLPLVEAIAAPRISSRNGAETADGGLVGSPTGAGLIALGHQLSAASGIGLASGVALALAGGRQTAAAETTRGGGGAARVVDATADGRGRR